MSARTNEVKRGFDSLTTIKLSCKHMIRRTLLGTHVVVAAPVERRREAVGQVADARGVEELGERLLARGEEE